MSVRKSLRRRAFQNLHSVCLTSVHVFWNSVSAIVWWKNDSGVQLTTMRRVGDVFDRAAVLRMKDIQDYSWFRRMYGLA